MHLTPAFSLCSRDTFGVQEQLFSFLTSSQECLCSRLCPDSNMCSFMVPDVLCLVCNLHKI
ncbi:hypothetical protein Nmel_007051 [Mimus melanotis]